MLLTNFTRRFLLLATAMAPFAVAAAPASTGAVYTMSNDATANQVVAYPRYADGSLGTGVWYMTGGQGSGSGLGSQGAVLMSPDEQFLFNVNAGSDSITSWQLLSTGLRRIGSYPSMGTHPVSLTMNGSELFVLNQGSDSIQGFVVSATGTLTAVPSGWAALSGTGVAGAQISFTSLGNVLVVTEKNSNNIVTYRVGANGAPVGMKVTPSSGMTPFGFAVGQRNTIYVSEAAGGAAGAGTVSSYKINADGTVSVITGSLANTQSAPCWVAMVDGGRMALIANTGSSTVSAMSAGFNGALALTDAMAAVVSSGAIDIASSNNGRFAYVLQNGGSLNGFGVMLDGTLAPIPSGIVGLAPSVGGLAAR
ncbi:MAG: beta-propeller fold lactonase family protein [Bryobacteraceae bacterium]